MTKDVQDMYLENNKIFVRETEKNLNKWKDKLCSWIGKVNTVKMSILSKLLCALSTTPIKNLSMLFHTNRIADSKINTEMQKIKNSQNKFEKDKQY